MGEQGETDREGSRVVGEGSLSAQEGERENEEKEKFSSNMVAIVVGVVESAALVVEKRAVGRVACYNMKEGRK
jgi:hypothetical protein